MTVTYGAAGWVRINDSALAGITLYLRLADDGRVTDLYLESGNREITAPNLRGLPLGKFRAQALSRPDRSRRQQEEARIPLAPPGADGLTVDFLRDVARAYKDALGRGERPNVALAEQSKHPRRTVERWVYLARKGGHLPPTNRGEQR